MADRPRTVIVEEGGRSLFGKIVAGTTALISFVWMLNLGFGVAEIPDFLPFVGNIDEGAASWLLFASLSYLGVSVVPDPSRASKFVRKTIGAEAGKTS
ncbi:MAG: hypothetical protein GC168_15605 [Candidatus Hydrogenedens sp.]|nr:hypothetical protein [Candidatus Hydrogenedens sp.]